MKRYQLLKEQVLQTIDQKTYGFYKRNALSHLSQVSALCLILSKQRNLDQELSGIIGLLHDISIPFDMNERMHALRSAQLAQGILEKTHLFKEDEIAIVVTAIRNHSSKERIDDNYSELIKDADVYIHYLEGDTLKESDLKRISNL